VTGALLLALNVPAILVVVLMLAAGVTYVLRDWERVTALVAAGICAVIALLLSRLDVLAMAGDIAAESSILDSVARVQHFGYTLALHDDALPALGLAFLISTVALLLASRFPQGRSFVPMALTLLAGYTIWFLATSAPVPLPLVLPLGLIILSAISAIALQAGRPSSAGGPLRWMVAPVLAFPLFLVANWFIEQSAADPANMSAPRTAAALLTFGLLLLMAPVPLHSVAPATAETAPPMATTLFTLLYQLALIFLISHVVIAFPFMQTLAPLSIWFAWAGLVTAIWAGAAAIGASQPGRLWGYLSLHDWGLIILLLSVPGLRTWSLVVFLFVLRCANMLTSAAGLMAIEFYAGSLEPERLRGVGVRLPWNTAAYLLGGLGLVGFPLSAGFAGHWAALQIVAASDWRPAAAVMLSSAAAILALIRMARLLYGPLANPGLPREKALGVATAAVMLTLSFVLAIAPQVLNWPVSRAILALGI
jgi:formate hydrogenlyase subunit 3/multisubunit Na+/H+ antiporter MnhD subunit